MSQGSTGPANSLVGRDAEVRLLKESIRSAEQHRGRLLVLVGEPGVGKSSLIDEAARAAETQGFLVLRTAGMHLESRLPFAGLHQLLDPRLCAFDDLPTPRRNALLVAFGLAEGEVTEPFLIGLAVLQLITELPGRRPVMLAVDDAHWLDRETTETLAFVARRISSDPVLIVASIRPGFATALTDSVTDVLPVAPLDEDSALILIRSAASTAVSVERERRVLDWAQGNPLALIEFGKALEDGSLRELPRDEGSIPTTARLRSAFTTRTLGLPNATQLALAAAAVNDASDLSDAIKAAAILSHSEAKVVDIEPAVAAGLVQISDGRLAFRHPLVRAAVSDEMSGRERQRIHGALAEVVEDPLRRAWHQSLAVSLPDEQLATELESIARAAKRRGGVSVALAAQRRSVALTEHSRQRSRRLLVAAELAFELGDRALVQQLLADAEQTDLDPIERGRADFLSEIFGFRPWSNVTLIDLVSRAEEVGRFGETDLALKLLVSALQRSYWSDPGPDVLAAIAAAAEKLNVPPDDPQRLTIAAHAAPVERGGEVIELARRTLRRAGHDHANVQMAAAAAAYAGDIHLEAAYAPSAIIGLRRQGRLARTVHALYVRSTWAYFTGEWSEGLIAATEAADLAVQTSQPQLAPACRIAASHIAAVRGELESARTLIEADPDGVAYDSPAQTERARGLIALAAGDHQAAFTHLRRLFHPADSAFHSWIRVRSVTELVEASASSGNQEEAARLIHDLEEAARRTPAPLLQASLAFARPLLAEPSDAEQLYEVAAEFRDSWPFIWARGRLAYGLWLRRQRRTNDSRPVLRQARDELDRLGAAPWAARARAELRAAGEASPAPAPDILSSLTPQELQIALLAAEGLTNRQIGERLFLSHRTVGSYLYQVFPKLGVSSRIQLVSILAVLGEARPRFGQT